MQAILFDMDGVLYEGEQAIAGAADTLAWCRQSSIPYLFLTNTTSRPRSDLVKKLKALGIEASTDDILTPAVAATTWLRSHCTEAISLFVPAATREEFRTLPEARTPSQPIGAVVLGDLGEEWDYATYNRAFRQLMDNPDARLLALGMTRYWRAEDGLRLDVGPFVKGLQYAVGIEPLVMGKPSPDFFRTALAMLGVEAGETLMIGDDIRSDIEAAQNAGLHGVLVRTGKFQASDLSLNIKPERVIDSIAGLPRLWEELSA